ncbi:hypothetical protein F5144DRAFT_487778 [Chaetomium tenue]|uniref:Uncharacterized protein n=1 Tax=Chaetomium tenue TaxID=1854479 RepID=A0ACB7PFN2_9PEZI|nr:hypothetical protein F5144DRAFT_487778 [Chaetomium globosum]
MQEANGPRTAPLHDPRGPPLHDLRGPLLGGRRTAGKVPLRLWGRSGDRISWLPWLVAMSDMMLDQFRGVLGNQPLNQQHPHEEAIYYDLNLLSGGEASEPYATAVTTTSTTFPDWPDDIENIYTGLHRCVDQVVATISVRGPPRLDQIKEQNRKVIDKLRTLESAITGNTAAAAAAVVSIPWSPLAHDPDRARINPDKRRRVSLSKRATSNSVGADTRGPSMTHITQQKTPGANSTPRIQPHGTGTPRPLFSGLDGDSKLAKKLQRIGAEEARAQVTEFAAQLRAPERQNALPTISQFSNMSQMADASHFRQLVQGLGVAIESSIFGEQNSRIRKRIALAHFYHAYALAQEYPTLFLSWCDDQQVQAGSMLPKGGSRSVVQHRFADLIFPPDEGSDAASDAKRKTLKIQMWRKSGKKWTQMIERMGYGILLLLPSGLSDEE